MPRPTDDPYLTGNYAPVADETSIPELPVDGAVPPGLQGRYVRVGPNPIGNAARPYVWSDAAGMVHEVTLRGPRSASYRNRWISTRGASRSLGTEPVPGAVADDTPANRNVLALGHRALAFGGRAGYELGVSLETRRHLDLDLEDDQHLVGRPRVDPTTGTVHLLASSSCSGRTLHQVLTPAGHVVHRRLVSCGAGCELRDFLLTEDALVLFRDDAVGVLLRGERTIEWTCTSADDVEPITAWQTGSSVSVLVAEPWLSRWTIDRGRLGREQLGAVRISFAHADERESHRRPPRRVYALVRGTGMPFDGTVIVQYDLVAGTVEHRDLGPGRHPGEFVYVPDARRRGEDGGWLVGLVHDDSNRRAELAVLDARAIGSPALATVDITRRVPYGLHGSFAPWPPTTHRPSHHQERP